MLDIGKVPGQSYAQMIKSKAANASAAKNAASQRLNGGFDSENFRGLCRGIFSLGLRRICKKIPLRNFSGHPNCGYLLVI